MKQTNAEWLEERGESADDYRSESTKYSECCEEPIDDYGFCTKCGEHAVGEDKC